MDILAHIRCDVEKKNEVIKSKIYITIVMGSFEQIKIAIALFSSRLKHNKNKHKTKQKHLFVCSPIQTIIYSKKQTLVQYQNQLLFPLWSGKAVQGLAQYTNKTNCLCRL